MGELGSYWLMGRVSVLQDKKSYGDWLHSSVDVLIASELTVHWERVKIVNFMSRVFYENLKTINRRTLQIVLFLHSPAHNLNTENQGTNNIIFSSLPSTVVSLKSKSNTNYSPQPIHGDQGIPLTSVLVPVSSWELASIVLPKK